MRCARSPQARNAPKGPIADWRRASRGSCARPLTQTSRGQGDSLQDTVMHATPTEMPGKGLGDLFTGRIWICVQQGLGSDQYARKAIAALAGLQLQKSDLQRMRPLRR